MHRLRHENKYGDLPEVDANDVSQAGSSLTIHDANYHLNDLGISTGEDVDPYAMPSQEHARTLFTTYVHRVHPTFPIAGQLNLQAQFNKYLLQPMSKPPPKWLAIINLIFAIAAKYSHLIRQTGRPTIETTLSTSRG